MKRLTLLIALGAVLLVGSLMTHDDLTAGGIVGYSSTFEWTFYHDTVKANSPNTDTVESLSGSADAKIFLYNGIGKATNVRGVIWCEMPSYDTNNAGDLMDTANDTAAFLIFSGFADAPDTTWRVYGDSLLSSNTYEGAVHFNVPSDSVIGDFIFFKFVTINQDSNLADSGSSCTYKATVIMKATE